MKMRIRSLGLLLAVKDYFAAHENSTIKDATMGSWGVKRR